MTRSLPTKTQIMREISDLLGNTHIDSTIGSSVPSVFFSDVAAAMGIPIVSGMPSMARRIIENTGLTWMPEFSSENSPSGGGGTVTTLGLLQLKNAVLIWLGHESNGLPEAYKDWEPAPDWQEKRSALPREITETVHRPGASEFRTFVLDAYDNTCVVSKYVSIQTIEIAHIVPYYGVDSDHIENAIPLRADLHKLFDKGLLLIIFNESEKKYRVKIHDFVMNDYKDFNGIELIPPLDRNFAPSRLALNEHEKLFKSMWQMI